MPPCQRVDQYLVFASKHRTGLARFLTIDGTFRHHDRPDAELVLCNTSQKGYPKSILNLLNLNFARRLTMNIEAYNLLSSEPRELAGAVVSRRC